jgi:hypothetical protein
MMSFETSLEEVVAYITGAKEPSLAMPSATAVLE